MGCKRTNERNAKMKSPGKADKRSDAFSGSLSAFFRPAARAVRRLWVAVLCRMEKAVDIGSNGEWPGAMLSNFAPHAFTFRGIRFACMERLLQGLKFAGEEKQAKIFGMEGKQAKRKGKKRKWWLDQTLYWQGHPMGRTSAEYASLVREAFDALSENSGFREALLATGGKRLYHTMGKTDPAKTVLTEGEFCALLGALRARIRQNAQFPHGNCQTESEAIGTENQQKPAT